MPDRESSPNTQSTSPVVSLTDAQSSLQAIVNEAHRNHLSSQSPPNTSTLSIPSGCSSRPRKAQIRKAQRIIAVVEGNIRTTAETLSFKDGHIPGPFELQPLLRSASNVVESSGRSLSSTQSSDPEVTLHKEKVTKLLRSLDSRIRELGSLLPTGHSDSAPVLIKSGKILASALRFSLTSFLSPDTVLNSPVAHLDVIAQVIIVLSVVCHVIIGMSMKNVEFIIDSAILLVKLAFTTSNLSPSLEYNGIQQSVLKQLPTSLYTALSKFDLDCEITVYAICPSCSCIFKPIYDPVSAIASYPQNCTNHLMGAKGTTVCGAPLLEMRKDQFRPIKPYAVASFRDYLARLLANRELERLCDLACDEAFAALHNEIGCMRNIFQAEFMRSFEGPTPGKLFIERREKVRLAFLMHVDFFNPNGVRERGVHNSIGIITLANLNLPECLRYQPENIYLAIIPGPHEPTAEQINYFIKPIIDEFKIGWEPGFRVSHTASSPNDGRDVNVALVLSLNDLPAARKASGFAGPTSHFICTRCALHGRDNFYNVDFENWCLRDAAELRQKAEEWRDATTLRERKDIFKSYGVRWSEFWRLSYWDPSQMLVIDPMHCLLEGLVHYHCRTVLGIDAKEAGTVIPQLLAFSYPWVTYTMEVPSDYRMQKDEEIRQVTDIHNILMLPLGNAFDENQLLKKLLTKNKMPLKFACYSLNLLYEGTSPGGKQISAKTKQDFGEMLVKWVSHALQCCYGFLTNCLAPHNATVQWNQRTPGLHI
jgi:hypothetical protein